MRIMLVVLLSAVGFLLGVAVAALTGWSVPGFCVFLLMVLLRWRWRIAIVFFCVLCGFWRVFWWQAGVPRAMEAEQVSVEGRVVEDWGAKEGKETWVVSTERGLVLVRISAFQLLQMGDVVELHGFLESTAEVTQSESYLHYLQRHGVFLNIDRAEVVVLRHEFSVQRMLRGFSDKLTARLQDVLPEPEASLAVGLLLGRRAEMDSELQQAFQTVGLTHIVAISGSNIALVVALFFVVFSFLPFYRRVVASVLGVTFFVLLVGASAAVLRAGLMGVLTLLGLYSGRKSQALFGLLWSAVIMVVLNPMILLYDVGFQLSFASTLGILTVSPVLERVVPQTSRPWLAFLRESLVLTLSAQLTTLPFILYAFGRISWITPVANLVVAPLIPLAMSFSALALIFGAPGAALAWVFLMLIEKSALLFAAIPGVQVQWQLSSSAFVLSLLILSGGLILFYKSKWGPALLHDHAAGFSRALNREFGKRWKQ